MLADVLRDSHLSMEDDVPGLLARHVSEIGATDLVLYLVDYEQRFLVPVPAAGRAPGVAVDIDATVAGWCFRTLTVQTTHVNGGGRRVWVPVVDGTERLGVLKLDFADDGDAEQFDEVLPSLAALAAEMVMSKTAYGDLFERVRRRRPMSLAAELLWQLLPPLTFGSERVVITAAIAPAHDVGGDAFDYAVNGDSARFAVFDAMGHGLSSGLMTAVALAAYRNSRREGADLADTARTIDTAIETHIGDIRYVTGVLAELDLGSGRLRWCIAGHPRPFIVRRGRAVRTLETGASVPFGLGTVPGIGEETLEPGDRVFLYTDGITEGRGADGAPFGVARFIDLVSRTSADEMPPPETMRRLIHAVLAHQNDSLGDDATALIVQWPGHAAQQLTIEGPQS
jgi:serine/threonine protein phosphatase PrpC